MELSIKRRLEILEDLTKVGLFTPKEYLEAVELILEEDKVNNSKLGKVLK